jgi:uncharacterized membrane protein YraQ (UPF0718 family)
MTEAIKAILFDFWATALEMSPYLLFGFFMAGLLSVLVSQRLVEKHLGGRGVWPLVKVSLFGVPLPLCSCSVIPVTMSLHKHGATRGSAIAFLLSTPQTGVDSIFVTYSLLGPVFAVFRPVAALITGIVGGLFVSLIDDSSKGAAEVVEKCNDSCCENPHKSSCIVRALKYGFVRLPSDIGVALLIGLIAAAFISALIPDGFFADKLGTGIGAMVIMMLLGIPVYVCATASVPVAAAMIMKGLTPGAALVFLMTGPATNAASFITIWKVLGGKSAVAYILTVIVCALAGGLLMDYFFRTAGASALEHVHGTMMPEPVKYAAAAVLFVVLAVAIIRDAIAGKKH